MVLYPDEVLPEDVARFLVKMTGFREEVNAADFGHEAGEAVRDAADQAANLCDLYSLKYVRYYEDDPDTGKDRAVYSDGTKGPYE